MSGYLINVQDATKVLKMPFEGTFLLKNRNYWQLFRCGDSSAHGQLCKVMKQLLILAETVIDGQRAFAIE